MFKLIWKIQRSSLMNMPRTLSFSFRSLVSREPGLWLLYQPYIWWVQMKRKATNLDPKESVIHQYTEMVIDGFQGSANSFATEAFKRSQTRHVNLSNHLHSPAQIIQAIKQDIPILLTIREPGDTVVSLTSRWPHVSVTQGLRSYIGFYNKLKPYTANCIISTFDQTTQHLDQVLAKVNVKFGTKFDLVDVVQSNAFREEKERDSEKEARRKIIKQEKRKDLDLAKNTQLLTQANEVYQYFKNVAQD
jgi:hypothetical protein